MRDLSVVQAATSVECSADSMSGVQAKLSVWDSVSGQYVHAWESNLMAHWLSDLFGYYAIQLGHGARISALAENRCSERCVFELLSDSGVEEQQAGSMEEDEDHQGFEEGLNVAWVDDFAHLPLESESVDVVVLPHTLDEHVDPRAVLREAHRVLRGQGRMIILGFNPLSAWGAQAKLAPCAYAGHHPFGFYAGLPHAPIHIQRLKDWLELLNCDVVQGAYGCYAPYVRSAQWLRRWHWTEAAGDRWWGFAGAVYALMVVKRVYAPTWVGGVPIQRVKRPWVRRPVVGASVPPAAGSEEAGVSAHYRKE